MESDNWVVQNLMKALETWNEKLSEIWELLTQSPETFRGGGIWAVMVNINGALQAIGYALLVLFFVVGVVKTCGSFTEVKRPEHAVKLFVRFALAKGIISYGMELMLALFTIVQGIISSIMNTAGFGNVDEAALPEEIDVYKRQPQGLSFHGPGPGRAWGRSRRPGLRARRLRLAGVQLWHRSQRYLRRACSRSA